MKEKKYLIYGICLSLLIVIGVTLAYFITEIEGDKKDVTINTGDLRVIFNNGEKIEGTDIEPGWSVTKTFSIENKSKTEYKYNIVIQDLVNTFVSDNLVYKITSTNNGHNMTDYEVLPKSETAEDTILTYSTTISGKTTQEYTIEVKFKEEDRNQYEDMGKTITGKIYITEGTKNLYADYKKGTLGYQIMGDNPTRKTRSNNNNGTNDFATPFTETTTGTLFTSTESITGITDTPKEVYYYAGNTTNNWVKFGGFYWRIIRTNHDGSIRLLYVGTSHDTTTGNIGNSAFNENYDSPKYVGYKYGEDDSTLDGIRENAIDSTIKQQLDIWFTSSPLESYSKYLSASAVYCNDRNEETEGTYTTSTSSSFYFASHKRLFTDKTPTYNCSNIKDAFSVDNTSAKLNYPIALMTADEIVFAGGTAWYASMSTPYAWFISNSSGTQVSSYWWSLSPILWNGSVAREWDWDFYSAFLSDGYVGRTDAVRPAISLKSCTLYGTGDGTAENPYTILETDSGC